VSVFDVQTPLFWPRYYVCLACHYNLILPLGFFNKFFYQTLLHYYSVRCVTTRRLRLVVERSWCQSVITRRLTDWRLSSWKRETFPRWTSPDLQAIMRRPYRWLYWLILIAMASWKAGAVAHLKVLAVRESLFCREIFVQKCKVWDWKFHLRDI